MIEDPETPQTRPLVSVIMPAWNSSSTIRESIQSVRSQSVKDWELIIVDDMSDDDTLAAIEDLVHCDERITAIRLRKKSGGAGARNTALDQAKGRYIAFLDADDLWAERKLENQIEFMESSGYDMSYTSYYIFYDNTEEEVLVPVPKMLGYRKLLRNNFIGCLTLMYARDRFSKLRMPLIEKRHDFAFWLLLLRKGANAGGLNRPLGRYRVSEKSLSKNKGDAVRFYWRVVARLEGVGTISSGLYLASYLLHAFSKKHLPKLYRVLCRIP